MDRSQAITFIRNTPGGELSPLSWRATSRLQNVLAGRLRGAKLQAIKAMQNAMIEDFRQDNRLSKRSPCGSQPHVLAEP